VHRVCADYNTHGGYSIFECTLFHSILDPSVVSATIGAVLSSRQLEFLLINQVSDGAILGDQAIVGLITWIWWIQRNGIISPRKPYLEQESGMNVLFLQSERVEAYEFYKTNWTLTISK
jgi:hypothetical protein